MLIFGHRGAAGYVAENTLPSIRHALAMGVDGVEFDVRLTQDKVPVLIHDETLDRTTLHSGTVRDLTFAELAELLADAESVPTLAAVLSEIGTRGLINVELKEFLATPEALAVLLEAESKQVFRAEQVLVSSFDHDAIVRFRELTKKFSVGLLTKGLPDATYWSLAEQLHASSANIDLPAVNADFVRTAKEHGLQVMVYTVNSLDDANRMRSLGVDAIFSDFPDRVRS